MKNLKDGHAIIISIAEASIYKTSGNWIGIFLFTIYPLTIFNEQDNERK